MKAIRFNSYGEPSVLQSIDLPNPQLKSDEVLVQVHASAINPSDVKNVAGVFHATLPRIPGRDFAGVVVEGPKHLGEHVWGSGAGFGVVRDGTHAEYVAVRMEALALKPGHLSMSEAAAIGIPFLAAWMGLEAAQVLPGETVFVTGAAGSVGRAVTQIARWKKARVFGLVRPDQKTEADQAVIQQGDSLSAQIKELTGGKGVDISIDCVGSLFEECAESLKRGGRQIALTAAGDGRVSFNLTDFYHELKRLIGIDTMKLSDSQIAGMLEAMRPGFESRALMPPEFDESPFSDAVSVYTAVVSKTKQKKQILRMVS
jgi:NADPH:quinone reductase